MNENVGNDKRISMASLFWLCSLVAVILGIVLLLNNNKIKSERIIEVQELYREIIPYEGLSFGDAIVAEDMFNSLIKISDDFRISNGIANGYTISGKEIEVVVGDAYIQTPTQQVKVDAELIKQYYDVLVKLAASDTLGNPGIKNIEKIEISGDNKIKFIFKTEEAYNIIALTEYFGYYENGLWYGTDGVTVYGDTYITVDNIKYVNANNIAISQDERIATMVFSNADKSENINKKPIPNKSYGFLTWTNNCTLSNDQRVAIFSKLNKSGIRNNLEFKASSIFDDTRLYKPADYDKSNIDNIPNLKIAVVNLGSYTKIADNIKSAFESIGPGVTVDILDLNDILSGTDHDLIYVRLSRGKSPDFSGLLDANGLLGKAGYFDTYTDLKSDIFNAKTWEELCESCAELDKQLRSDGVWFFIDQAFDIVSTK